MTTGVEEEPAGVVCRCYTRARRHPKVIGVIQGHALPWTSTYTQFVGFILTFLALVLTRRVWSAFTPLPLQIVAVIGLPVAVWNLAKKWQPDHRSPHRALIAMANYYSTGNHATYRGRRVRTPRPIDTGGRPVYFCGGPR